MDKLSMIFSESVKCTFSAKKKRTIDSKSGEPFEKVFVKKEETISSTPGRPGLARKARIKRTSAVYGQLAGRATRRTDIWAVSGAQSKHWAGRQGASTPTNWRPATLTSRRQWPAVKVSTRSSVQFVGGDSELACVATGSTRCRGSSRAAG